MVAFRVRLLLAVLGFSGAIAFAQEEPAPAPGAGEEPATAIEDGEAEEEGETSIEIGGEGDASEPIDLEIDPFLEDEDPVEEPNRPDAVVVGEWRPPPLDEAGRRTLDALLEERGRLAGDAGVRYRLADFYLDHGWIPQAESEFLAAAERDPESIRPWEGLLQVYAWRPAAGANRVDLVIPPGLPPPLRRQLQEEFGNRREDWLPSDRERARRITRAYEEILDRRPDDVARRRELIDHLRQERDYERLALHAREVLERLPDDARTRYELADALLHRAAILDRLEAGSGQALRMESMEILEENVRRVPDHAPSLLRLSRMLEVLRGPASREQALELERRGFFHLFIRPQLAPVPYRDDTLRLATNIAGVRIANRLWDEAMCPPGWLDRNRWNSDRTFVRRWLDLRFPHAQPRGQLEVVETLARRGDAAALGTLVSFLWSVESHEIFEPGRTEDRSAHDRMVQAAIDAVARMRGLAFTPCDRFLRLADTPLRRRRGVALLGSLGDPRAVDGLVLALDWDPPEGEASFGVAASLERLGDPRSVDALVRVALDPQRPLPLRLEAAEALAVFSDPRVVETYGRLRGEEGFGLVAAYGMFRVANDDAAFENLARRFTTGDQLDEVLRLVRKFDHPRFGDLLLEGLRTGPEALRGELLDLLRARYWETARAKVLALMLSEAKSPAVSDFAIRTLGDLGGEEAAGRLLELLEGTTEWGRYQTIAQAFAETGDERAVRYFNRMRILEKDEQRRMLARALHNLAEERKAARDAAQAGAPAGTAGR